MTASGNLPASFGLRMKVVVLVIARSVATRQSRFAHVGDAPGRPYEICSMRGRVALTKPGGFCEIDASDQKESLVNMRHQRRVRRFILLFGGIAMTMASGPSRSGETRQRSPYKEQVFNPALKPEDVMKSELAAAMFENAAFISVDLQDDQITHVTEKDVDPDHVKLGANAADVNAVLDYLRDVARPNAAKLVTFFRERNIPVIMVHWGFRVKGGYDLDPEVRQLLLRRNGPDWTKWGHYVEDSTAHPWSGLNPQPTDIILAKSGQDAFTSCNIDFVLKNLGARNLFFVGGHTNGCLYKTGSSAVARGYFTICVEDATWDFCMSHRLSGIASVDFDVVCKTEDVLKFEQCK